MNALQFTIAYQVAQRKGISLDRAAEVLFGIKNDDKVYSLDIIVGDQIYEIPIYTLHPPNKPLAPELESGAIIEGTEPDK